ncbi:hypothetical protein L6452_43401 [Arctium lappa]|uniref:Uncharacterized protein n=2 Tax=Arctium lappa TaxID=4217 RepID=A0ACB8XDG2_ARCLA|nr:hypothetical protein L6452_43396 [Arctium lappa]KAI3664793.1 hypothetical protein L6452_43401 [Arctium lappa]
MMMIMLIRRVRKVEEDWRRDKVLRCNSKELLFLMVWCRDGGFPFLFLDLIDWRRQQVFWEVKQWTSMLLVQIFLEIGLQNLLIKAHKVLIWKDYWFGDPLKVYKRYGVGYASWNVFWLGIYSTGPWLFFASADDWAEIFGLQSYSIMDDDDDYGLVENSNESMLRKTRKSRIPNHRVNFSNPNINFRNNFMEKANIWLKEKRKESLKKSRAIAISRQSALSDEEVLKIVQMSFLPATDVAPFIEGRYDVKNNAENSVKEGSFPLPSITSKRGSKIHVD